MEKFRTWLSNGNLFDFKFPISCLIVSMRVTVGVFVSAWALWSVR